MIKIQPIQSNNYRYKCMTFRSNVNDSSSKNDITTPKPPTEVEFQMLNASKNKSKIANPVKSIAGTLNKIIQSLLGPKTPEKIEEFDFDKYLLELPYSF